MTAWDPSWFDSVAVRSMRAWRAVEAQHVVATMRLVDTVEEQGLLEQLLESSKPALPEACAGKHYLLSTPFRYRPPHASRFRRADSWGIWYGAEHIRTACAEVAYWRWRFLTDSLALQDEELLTEHTLFAAQVHGPAIDLLREPWISARASWTHPDDYGATHALADAARQHAVSWIRYESVRDPGAACCAVLAPQALSGVEPASQQTWHCRVTRRGVRMVRGDEAFEWTLAASGGA